MSLSAKLNRITPNLWFDHQAEEAALYYVDIFADSRIERMTRYGAERHRPDEFAEGAVLTVEFVLDGQRFVALNGGPQYSFTEAVSFIVQCESQEEIDYYWDRLGQGGDEKAKVCGWLKDKFGVSWQIVPANLTDMISDPDPVRAARVTKAMLRMQKLDMQVLQAAYADEG